MDRTAEEARATIWVCLIVGILGTAVGIAVLVANAPGPREDPGAGIVVGYLLLAVSWVLVLVGVIAWGVILGVWASGRFPEPSTPRAPTAPPVSRRRRTPGEMTPLDPLP